jgi:PIN domain nuclease of toxin-antitoxin system
MLLLDTHIILWFMEDDPRLGAPIRATMEQAAPNVFVSIATAWEMSIKAALGKLRVPTNLEATLAATGVQVLAITMAHALAAGALPLHHRDPFDRMLIAQVWLEGLTLVTHDARMRPYGVPVLWA